MKQSFKSLLYCSALLISLSLIPLSSISANHKTNYSHPNISKITHKTSKSFQRTNIIKLGQLDAKKDFNKFNGVEDYEYLFAHPHYFHNSIFTNAYTKELAKLVKSNNTDSNLDTSINDIKIFKHYLPIYQKLRGNTKKGFLNANSNQYIPRNKRHNLAFARGYLLANMYVDNVNKIKDDAHTISLIKSPTISEIVNYYQNGNGKVSAISLGGIKKGKIYNSIINLETQSNKNAWTSKQMKYHTEIVMKHLHLNKALKHQFKTVLNPWNSDDYGNNLAKGKFASNINKQYPYHHSMYYPKNMDGGRSAGQYEGEIIYLHDNKQTRHTNQAFRKYMKNYMIYHAGKDCDDIPKNSKTLLKYMKYFKHNYTNHNYKGQNNTPYTQWRIISHKHHAYSDILYLIPQNGWNYYLVKN